MLNVRCFRFLSNLHRLFVFRHDDFGFIARCGSAKSSQYLWNIPRAVEDADNLQAARLARHAVENQIIREAAHGPETHPGKLGAVGLVTRADFRPLRQRAKAQTQRIKKTVGGIGVVRCNEQVYVRHVANRFPGADDFKRLQVL